MGSAYKPAALGIWQPEKYIDSKARKLYTDYKELQRNELPLDIAGEKRFWRYGKTMEKERLLRILENGKQIGISRIIEVDTEQIAYTCAMQKKQGRYAVYTDEYNLDTFYADELEESTETISWYDNQTDCLSHFHPKYGIQFEDLSICKGQKFFNIDLKK